jgi:hypothetical protein
MEKKVIISTWCTDDYRDYIGIDELTKSIHHFHPEIEHHINNEPWTPETGNWNCAQMCLERTTYCDMVIHLDGDTIVLGDLNELISSDADMVGTLNNNTLGKAGGNDGITTPLHMYNSENEQYTPVGRDIAIDKWLNMGVLAMNNIDAWKEWERVNVAASSQGYRLPAPYGDENDTWNLVFHGGRFSTEIIDDRGTNISYNLQSMWSDGPYNHYESWKNLYVKDEKVYYNDPVSGVPHRVKVLHQAGGDYSNALNKEAGGFRNWLKRVVSPEVKDFIEHITN